MSRPQGVQALDLSLALRAEAVLPLLDGLPDGAAVADLGAGTGYFAELLTERGFRVTCVDVSEENVEHARRRGLEARTGDLTALPLESGSFDAAVCLEVLEHVQDDRAAARELHRILRGGGLAVVSVPNADAPLPVAERLGLGSVHEVDGPERHYRHGYSAAGLRALLEQAGFSVGAVVPVGGAPYRLAAGLVSLAHLGYRRLRGQQAWTWADVEQDAASPLLRVYRRVFPVLHTVARIGARRSSPTAATLVVRARA